MAWAGQNPCPLHSPPGSVKPRAVEGRLGLGHLDSKSACLLSNAIPGSVTLRTPLLLGPVGTHFPLPQERKAWFLGHKTK